MVIFFLTRGPSACMGSTLSFIQFIRTDTLRWVLPRKIRNIVCRAIAEFGESKFEASCARGNSSSFTRTSSSTYRSENTRNKTKMMTKPERRRQRAPWNGIGAEKQIEMAQSSGERSQRGSVCGIGWMGAYKICEMTMGAGDVVQRTKWKKQIPAKYEPLQRRSAIYFASHTHIHPHGRGTHLCCTSHTKHAIGNMKKTSRRSTDFALPRTSYTREMRCRWTLWSQSCRLSSENFTHHARACVCMCSSSTQSQCFHFTVYTLCGSRYDSWHYFHFVRAQRQRRTTSSICANTVAVATAVVAADFNWKDFWWSSSISEYATLASRLWLNNGGRATYGSVIVFASVAVEIKSEMKRRRSECVDNGKTINLKRLFAHPLYSIPFCIETQRQRKR